MGITENGTNAIKYHQGGRQYPVCHAGCGSPRSSFDHAAHDRKSNSFQIWAEKNVGFRLTGYFETENH
jgi:hypothetical protein